MEPALCVEQLQDFSQESDLHQLQSGPAKKKNSSPQKFGPGGGRTKMAHQKLSPPPAKVSEAGKLKP